jgi:hypothetical protein
VRGSCFIFNIKKIAASSGYLKKPNFFKNNCRFCVFGRPPKKSEPKNWQFWVLETFQDQRTASSRYLKKIKIKIK